MRSHNLPSYSSISHPPHAWRPLILLTAAAIMHSGPAWPQQTVLAGEVERSMYFIEKMGEATELFNSSQPQDALDIFQDLQDNYSDLDQDGYVATAIGDCLVIMGQYGEAAIAYDAAVDSHPELAENINQKLIELELIGEVTDRLIQDLRKAAQVTEETKPSTTNWQLGRALQKRAKNLLVEAVELFRSSPRDRKSRCFTSAQMFINQADLLEEFTEDLEILIDRLESRLGLLRQLAFSPSDMSDEALTPEMVTEKKRSEYVIRTKDGQRVEFQIKTDQQNCQNEIVANGRPIELTHRQILLIKRHEERINTILLEAVEQNETEQKN
ncbi:MAG: hypothetical protein ACYTF1_09885 [Planctomycetota bacterium]